MASDGAASGMAMRTGLVIATFSLLAAGIDMRTGLVMATASDGASSPLAPCFVLAPKMNLCAVAHVMLLTTLAPLKLGKL